MARQQLTELKKQLRHEIRKQKSLNAATQRILYGNPNPNKKRAKRSTKSSQPATVQPEYNPGTSETINQ